MDHSFKDWAAEDYRPAASYNPPEFFPQPAPQPAPQKARAETDEITVGRLLFHLFLLGLTVLTTTFAAGLIMLGGLIEGAVYSFTVLSILGAHEMGHYIACRWYGVRATLPYFIPVPLPPVGTFGAFIKIKSPIPSRRALFDIGIAGPLAGFIFAIPASFIAHYFAKPSSLSEVPEGGITFNDPLLFQFLLRAFHLPPTVETNPVWLAAWVGVFMTALNLLPIGQLDGGHVTYAVFGRRGHRLTAWASYISVIALAVFSVRSGMWNWVVFAALLTLVIRVGHPPVVDEDEPLGLARILVAIIGLLVFVLSFMPIPITIH
ncbi:MAG TPA: site-2 protease family protein [Blastocatellia bacterium]|nr:site-2 protease family protein [Blastocatellia bacterium]